jgi:tetratricopeptide (TPR) repeat protein
MISSGCSRSSGRSALVALASVAACAPRPVNLVVVTSSLAETVSLLGDTLYSPPLDAAGGPARVKRLMAARDAADKHPDDVAAAIELSRSTVAMGRLRDAVAILSKSAELNFNDVRLYRERGELLLRLRQLDLAVRDLRRAGTIGLERARLPEPGEVDIAGGGGLTTLQYQVAIHLGIALYCQGDFAGAREVLVQAANQAITPNSRSRAVLWLFFAERRIGDGSAARELLNLVQPEWADRGLTAELQLLFAYKGLIPSDSIQVRAAATQGAARALFSYGIAYYLLLQPGRRSEAEPWLDQARTTPDWTDLAVLVAEAELARLRARPPAPQPRPPTRRPR